MAIFSAISHNVLAITKTNSYCIHTILVTIINTPYSQTQTATLTATFSFTSVRHMVLKGSEADAFQVSHYLPTNTASAQWKLIVNYDESIIGSSKLTN